MSIRDFIREHRSELKEAISRQLNHVPRQASCDCPKSGTDHYHTDRNNRLDDAELRLWVLNDEGLYNWARSEGVRI
jgi:hypothetical protein